MDDRIDTYIDWIKGSARPANGLLVPVSGGSDSALAFWLCRQAYPDKTVGVHFGTDLRCRQWFESVGEIRTLPQPRRKQDRDMQRWAKSLAVAMSERRWLVGTLNRTEDALGTFSQASRLATYLPLAGLWKSEVMELCQLIGVPAAVLESSRRADPDCGRPQELAEIPLELIDLFLRVKESELSAEALAALNEAQLAYLQGLYQRNRFKQRLPTRSPVLTAPLSVQTAP